jgi:hypothetical protein
VRPKSQDGFKIDELAHLLHPRDANHKVFAVLESYLDESGIHDGAPVCVIAGYFGAREAWRQIEKSWVSTLNYFKIPLSDFHALHFVPRAIAGHKESRNLVRSLALLAKKHRRDLHPVSAAVVVDDFHSLTLNQRRFLTGAKWNGKRFTSSGCSNKPYFVPFQHCLKRITSYTPKDGRVNFFLGLGKTFSGYAEALYSQIRLDPRADGRLGQITFPQASETPECSLRTYLST